MSPQLLVCAPLGLEARALRAALGEKYVRRTGCGPRRSARSAAALTGADFDVLVIAGLAGGIGAEVRSGDVIVADELRGQRGTVRCPSAPSLVAELRRAGFPVHCGPIATTDHIVHGAQRAELAGTGALAVDMESAVLAEAAGSRPLGVVRVVVDTARQPLLRPGTPSRALAALARLHAIGPCLPRWGRTVSPEIRSAASKELY
ncbi:phosphorylase family protein [Saccharopolyspora sp. 5N708]|uniref:phosphorylase family protein n=1 Tax=Saccharopolyspora sp. 5N708 TaxID=3457424 RepID=UPI003FD0C56E